MGAKQISFFYRNAGGTGIGAGDQWIMGHNCHNVGAGNFAIGSSTIGRCLSINSTGTLNVHHPAIFNNSLTLGNNKLLSQLSTLAPKNNPIFIGVVSTSAISATGNINCIINGAGGSFRAVPQVSGSESSIGFYRNNNLATPDIGDNWVLGHRSWNAGDRNFGIGANGVELCF